MEWNRSRPGWRKQQGLLASLLGARALTTRNKKLLGINKQQPHGVSPEDGIGVKTISTSCAAVGIGHVRAVLVGLGGRPFAPRGSWPYY